MELSPFGSLKIDVVRFYSIILQRVMLIKWLESNGFKSFFIIEQLEFASFILQFCLVENPIYSPRRLEIRVEYMFPMIG